MWFIFLLFTVLILVFVYISQVVLMPVIYEYIKTQESISTTYEIKKTWVEGNFNNVSCVVERKRDAHIRCYIRIPVDFRY